MRHCDGGAVEAGVGAETQEEIHVGGVEGKLGPGEGEGVVDGLVEEGGEGVRDGVAEEVAVAFDGVEEGGGVGVGLLGHGCGCGCGKVVRVKDVCGGRYELRVDCS